MVKSNAQNGTVKPMENQDDLIEYKITSLSAGNKGFFKKKFYKKEDFVLVLKQIENPDEKITMLIGKTEALELAIAIEEMKTTRPLPSEVLRKVITELGFTVSKVLIDDLKDDIFYANLILIKGDEFKTIDCRPAEAFTQATRFGCSIFVSKAVIAKQKSS